jgi:hypothetical protein
MVTSKQMFFRLRLTQPSDAASEERDPGNFDPTVNQRGEIILICTIPMD